MNIPDEAVEAGLEALFEVFAAEDENGDVDCQRTREGDRHIVEGRINLPYAVRKVLEAAEPHMLTRPDRT